MGRTGKTILVAFTEPFDWQFDRGAVRIINHILCRVFVEETVCGKH